MVYPSLWPQNMKGELFLRQKEKSAVRGLRACTEIHKKALVTYTLCISPAHIREGEPWPPRPHWTPFGVYRMSCGC